MARLSFVVPICILTAACGLAQQREMQARAAQLKAESYAAAKRCDATLPPGNPKTAVARGKCQTEAWAIMRPTMPYPDLLDLLIAKRLAIAEQIEKGQLTIAQGNEAVAMARSEIIAEEQRRNLANRSVAAQESIATAAAAECVRDSQQPVQHWTQGVANMINAANCQ
jgi:hypothetical protein